MGKKENQNPDTVIFQATVSAKFVVSLSFTFNFLQLPASWFKALQLKDELLLHFRNDPINFNTLVEARQLKKRTE